MDALVNPWFLTLKNMEQNSKTINFGFKLWVMATPLGCCVQFCPYADKNSILHENIGIGLGASVVANLVSKPPVMQTSNY